MRYEEILEKIVDKSAPPVVIAEAADAHYGDMDRAKQMVLAAKASGADVVKFQHHIPAAEMLPDTPMSSNMTEPLWDFLNRNALTITQHEELKSFCDTNEIGYACTPFSINAAEELEENLDPFIYKIGSGEMSDHPTLLRIAEYGKPMFVSTGMSTVEEIAETYNLLIDRVPLLVLLNCTSAYPPRADQMHINFITEMARLFPRAVIGHSDHFPSNEFSLAAFTLGARVIERHFTVDESLVGPDKDVSLSQASLTELVKSLGHLARGMSSVKEIHEGEIEIREWAHRSLVYLRSLSAGTLLEQGDIWGKRPGTGVPSKRLNDFIGRKLAVDVKENTFLSESHFLP